MIQVLGKKSPGKRQFVYMLADILSIHYGKYEIYSENYAKLSEDNTDNLTVHPLKNYCGQEQCVIESEDIAIKADHTIYFLTPYQPEIKMFANFLDTEYADNTIIVYGEHIKESVLNSKYLSRMIDEKIGLDRVRLLTIEWDKINKLLCNEGLFDSYYQITPLSRDYKNALSTVLETVADISSKDIKRYFKWERRNFK